MSLEAEQEMWAAIASPDASTGAMSRGELDSLTVRMDERGRIELVNSGGLVGRFVDRDAAYAEVRRLRGLS